MSEVDKKDWVTVNVDGRDVSVPPGLTMIEAAEMAGKEVPHYCYHPKLSVSGNCRMCLVEMGMPMKDRGSGEPILDEDGKQKIGWMPKPAIACNSKVAPGLHIKTDSELVKDCRNGVMEFLLVNHPLDCPICDQAGECRLQEFATEYGRGYSRFIEKKNVKPKRTVLGPRVMLDDERCILCSRCIRFMKEVADDDVLGFIDRGSYSTLTCYPSRILDSNYSLNTVDICPVGALTSRDFRFKMRVWFLKPVQSICTESSVGANTEVWQREGKIYRITPRRNDEVNDTWMTDSGRSLYKEVEAENRLLKGKTRGREITVMESLRESAKILSQANKVALVVSTRSSVEEMWSLRKLADHVGADIHAVRHWGEEDELLLSADRTPNTRGALVTGLLSNVPGEDLSSLAQSIDRGEVDTLVCVHEDLSQHGLSTGQLEKVNLIYFGTHHHESLASAKVQVPTLTVFEKSGTFINQQFRLQKFNSVIPGPEGVLSDLQSFTTLRALLKEEDIVVTQPTLQWKELSVEISELEGIDYGKIPDLGVPLSPAKWLDLPFPEEKTLKFDAKTFGQKTLSALETAG